MDANQRVESPRWCGVGHVADVGAPVWPIEATTYAGNIRLYSRLDEARVRLMTRYLREAMPAAQAAELAKSVRLTLQPGRTAQVTGHDAALTARQMSDALDSFDESSAEQALQTLLNEYSSIAVIRDFLMPYLHEIGERWAANHMTIAQEHFASNFLHSRLLALARGWDRGLGPRAQLACGPGELHTLGLIAFGIALHAHGWRITYLGADFPVEMLASAATHVQPELIVVCASVAGRLCPVVRQLSGVATRWPLAIAGPGLDAELAARCSAIHLGMDPVSAAASVVAEPTGRSSTTASQ